MNKLPIRLITLEACSNMERRCALFPEHDNICLLNITQFARLSLWTEPICSLSSASIIPINDIQQSHCLGPRPSVPTHYYDFPLHNHDCDDYYYSSIAPQGTTFGPTPHCIIQRNGFPAPHRCVQFGERVYRVVLRL
jgi:hypothetical protein